MSYSYQSSTPNDYDDATVSSRQDDYIPRQPGSSTKRTFSPGQQTAANTGYQSTNSSTSRQSYSQGAVPQVGYSYGQNSGAYLDTRLPSPPSSPPPTQPGYPDPGRTPTKYSYMNPGTQGTYQNNATAIYKTFEYEDEQYPEDDGKDALNESSSERTRGSRKQSRRHREAEDEFDYEAPAKQKHSSSRHKSSRSDDKNAYYETRDKKKSSR